MLRYIKEFLESTANKYFVYREVQLLTISFNKLEKTLIRPGNIERSRYAQKKPKTTKGKSQLERYSEIVRATTVLIAEKVSAYVRLAPRVCNPDNLNNITDLRTNEDFQKILNTGENSKSQQKSTEERRQFDSVGPLKENATSSNVNEKQTHKVLKEKKEDMQRMLCSLNKQRDLRRGKLDTSSNNSVEEFLKESSAICQNQKVDISVKGMLENMLRSGELILKNAGASKIKEDKQGLIDINDVIEFEESKKEKETADVEVTKKASFDPISDSSRDLGDYVSIKARERNYFHTFIEHNRMMDLKMMNLQHAGGSVPKKSDESTKLRTNLAVKTDNNETKTTERTFDIKGYRDDEE